MTGAAFIGGEGPSRERCAEIARRADCIAAADSGLILAEEAGITPDVIAGDMDSLREAEGGESRLSKYPPESIFRYPADKDLTDTEVAIGLLEERGCDEIILAGGGGGRLAHVLAIKALFEDEDARVSEWHTARERIMLLRGARSVRVGLAAGSVVSIFPVGGGPWSARSEGLKWGLEGVRWTRDSFGISNVALEDRISVESRGGNFLMVMEAPRAHLVAYGAKPCAL
jgi:thiamine pyrophosphokinase